MFARNAAAGRLSPSYVACWDGSTWQPLGSGTSYSVDALTVYNGELIVGGFFRTAGGETCNNIARWNGSTWQPLGSGTNEYVFDLTVYNGELIVGGRFSVAGGLTCNRC
jgi:hypothetical protein